MLLFLFLPYYFDPVSPHDLFCLGIYFFFQLIHTLSHQDGNSPVAMGSNTCSLKSWLVNACMRVWP